MVRCSRSGCSWESIAPSRRAARERLLEHLVEDHARDVDAEIPEGKVQVRAETDDSWVTVTPEEARRLHDLNHSERDGTGY